LNQKEIGTWNLCNGIIMKMDYVKIAMKEKGFAILFLEKTKIPDGYDISLLNIQGFKLECELKSSDLDNKIRLVCYIRENIFSKNFPILI
jgi:hypothetical protein